MSHKKKRNIVVVNQASNYLTIGFCNAFNKKFYRVALITGSIHAQGEELASDINVSKINHWVERPAWKKSISYLVACVKIWWLLFTKYRNYEVLFVSIPPMGYLLNIVLPHRFSILIWDVYPDTFKITGMQENHPVYRIWAWLNKVSFRKAHKIFTIGNKMRGLVAQYVDRKKINVVSIWAIFQENNKVGKEDNPFVKENDLLNKFVVQYSGNIGLTHNVEIMVELAELLQDEPGILFQIIGRGPRVPHLQSLVEEKDLPNCQFLPFQSDDMFPYSLSAADLGVVILDQTTSKGSVPSKSYNLMSYGIPSLYIASKDSELHDYAAIYNHAICVSHERLDDAVKFILDLRDNRTYRDELSVNAVSAAKNYQRSNADLLVDLYVKGDINVPT